MKTLLLFLSFSAVLPSVQTELQRSTSTYVLENNAVVKYKLQVKGMSCSNCENSIKKALYALKGVKSVKPSHSSGTVEIGFDNSVCSLETIKKTLKDKGFTVSKEEKL